MRSRIVLWIVVPACLLFVGAWTGREVPRIRALRQLVTPMLRTRQFVLGPPTDCMDGRKALADAAVEQMESNLKVAREQLRYRRSTCSGGATTEDDPSTGSGGGGGSGSGGGGGGCGFAGDEGYGGGLSFAGGPAPEPEPTGGAGPGADPAPASGGQASEYTTTSVQTLGVDEADFVKNDGKYIYILSGGRFVVVDAWPPTDARELGSLALEGRPLELYVEGGRAVVFAALGTASDEGSDCIPGITCSSSRDGFPLRVTVLDLSDPSQPRLVRTLDFPGSYVESRRIGTSVFTVVYTDLSGLVDPPLDPDSLPTLPQELESYQNTCDPTGPFDDAAIDRMYEELRQANAAAIRADYADWEPPSFEDTSWSDNRVEQRASRPLADCASLYVPSVGSRPDFVSVVAFDLAQDRAPDVATILSGSGYVYASADTLFLATSRNFYQLGIWYAELPDDGQASTIHRFALDGVATTVRYTESGVVKGRVLNQFALSEHEGDLRVATVTGYLPDPTTHTTITVLASAGDGTLAPVGALDDISPGEDIRSVGFAGDVGFLVTFEKTDPLFTLDLADRTRPRIAGQLQVPGFSTFMQLMDERHLLTIGYDAQDMGDFSWFQGIELQVFDVGDLSRPALLQRTVIGTRGSSSEAATSHLAFSWFRARGLLAVPIAICDGGTGGTYGDEKVFDGLIVYRVSPETGFQLVGRMPRAGASLASCSSWWTASDSTVKRSIFMDDYVFAVEEDAVGAAAIADLAHPVKTVLLH